MSCDRDVPSLMMGALPSELLPPVQTGVRASWLPAQAYASTTAVSPLVDGASPAFFKSVSSFPEMSPPPSLSES